MKIPGKNIGFAGSGINANLQFGIGGVRCKGQSGEQDQASQKVSSLHIAPQIVDGQLKLLRSLAKRLDGGRLVRLFKAIACEPGAVVPICANSARPAG